MGAGESTPPPSLEFDQPWRNMPWGNTKLLEDKLRNFQVSGKAGKYVRILVVGEVGAGKSSFINSAHNAFQHRITSGALVDATSGISFTRVYKTHLIKGNDGRALPFVFNDIMGLEPYEGHGANTQDIIKALRGLMEEGYKFNPMFPLSEDSQGYRANPELQQQIFCLVNIIAADKISLMDQKIFDKLKLIRQAASELNVPQVVVMTKIDEACPLVKGNIQKVYTSKKIKKKMKECENNLGITMNHIFPVKNYHEEVDTNMDTDLLILKALEQIVQIADDALTDAQNVH